MLETITFALAMLGFGLLTFNAVFSAHGRGSRALSLLTAVVIVVHVLLVWAFRYQWSFAQATRNGYAGFGIFHLALASIVVSSVVAQHLARWLTLASYLIVCLGASGAVFRYEVVAVYRIPVLACVVGGLLSLARIWYLAHKARQDAAVATPS